MHTMSLNLDSFPPWKLLNISLWRSLRTSYFSFPVSGRLSKGIETSSLPLECEIRNFTHIFCLFLVHLGPSLMDWSHSCFSFHHIIICEPKTLAAQSPVYTCPLVLCTWTGPLTTSQMELHLQPLLPVPCYWFPSGTFLTFYGCTSTRLKPRTLSSLLARLPLVLVCTCPRVDKLPGR